MSETDDDIKAELERLKKENEALKAQAKAKPGQFSLKVSQKGAVSVYGMGRFHAWCRWVFHRNGRQIRSMRGAWNEAIKRAGFPEARPHDMRRSAVRNMRRAGVPQQTIMKVVGHRTRAMLDRYGIVADQDVEDAADAVAASISARQRKRLRTDVA